MALTQTNTDTPPPPNPMPPSPPSSRVNHETVSKAVKALLKWRNSKSETQKPQLLEHDDFIYLILTLKKIPPTARMNPHKIPLPHSLLQDLSLNELCLIIDDGSKSTLTKRDAAKKLKTDNIPISKVLKLSKLKSDYRPFEAKRKLCDSYDMFFADKRVIPLLPRLLGKHFFKKKKIPVPVDLQHKNWKEQIERACGSALLYLKTGTCCVVKVGRLSMGKQQILENVLAAINGIADIVPKKWGNVRSFHLKLLESLALPIYQAVPDLLLKIQGVNDKDENLEEIADKEVLKQNANENVTKKKKKKGRIHEVRYMDGNIAEIFDEDELGGDIGEAEDSETDKMGSGVTAGKKRKRGNGMKTDKNSKIDSNGVRQQKDGLSAEKNSEAGIKQKRERKSGEESAGKKLKEKKKKNKESGVGKLKSSVMKVKDLKKKKNLVAE